MDPNEPTGRDGILVRSRQALPSQDCRTVPGIGCREARQERMEVIGLKIGPEAFFNQLQSEESDTGRRIISDGDRIQMPYCAPARKRRVPIL